MSRRRTRFGLMIAGCIAAAIIAIVILIVPHTENAQHQHSLKDAWSRLSQLGNYSFSTTIEQITYPAPKTSNVGQSSTRDVYLVDGQTDLRAETLQIKLYKNTSNITNPEDGVEIKVADGVASGRNIGSSQWENVDSSFINTFAPGNDLSSFLVAARNVSAPDYQSFDLAASAAQVKSFRVAHYQFDIDSDAFAVYMRDQMTKELQRSGKLPAGMTLELSDIYRTMDANGEVWLTEEGYPVRLKMSMAFPQAESGERSVVNLSTDFQIENPDQVMAAATGSLPEKLSFWMGSMRESLRAEGVGSTLILFMVTILCGALVIAFSNSKVIYTGIATFVIISMVVSPIWQDVKAAQFSSEMQAKQQAQQAAREADQAAEDNAAAILGTDWNPNLSPFEQTENSASDQPASPSAELPSFSTKLQAAEDTSEESDSDQDGLTDSYEESFDITVLNPNMADTDSDGLNDSEELKLGIQPGNLDSDNDGIPDLYEVEGFRYANQDWYSNPLNNDSDGDGLLDGIECQERVSTDVSGTPGVCKDTDNDGIPDIFDTDDDGDGVSSYTDESPYFYDSTIYKASSPYKFNVSNLESDKDIFITYQLQPENIQHLTLSMNVLDWPTGDTEGQVQRISDSTFADQLSDEQKEYDPKAAYGDMRLIPMLQIRLTGSSLPLPLTDHFTFAVTDDDFEGVFTATARTSGSDTLIKLKLEDATSGTYQISTAAGTCAEGSTPTSLGDFTIGTEKNADIKFSDMADGKYSIFINQGGQEKACLTVPAAAHGTMTDKVVDDSTLNAYGATVRNDTNGDVLIYTPLSLVTDFDGANPTAFTARIPYSNQSNRFDQSQQQLSVVWIVNMLTDICKPVPEDYNASSSGDWCDKSKPERWYQNQTQVVQTYDDPFRVTGLSVTEDHGVNMDVIFENPATDTDLEFDDPLWALSQGLNSSFLSGREDMTLTEIANRFDADLNTGLADDDTRLWGLQKNAFQVLQYSYPNVDQIAQFFSQKDDSNTSSQVQTIFSTYFTGSDSQPLTTEATLLFARQQSSRGVSYNDPAAQCSGGVCTLDMAGTVLQTQSVMNWSPYQYSDGSWQAYPVEEYLDLLESKLRNTDEFQFDTSDEDARQEVNGRIFVARSYYESLQKGVATLTRMDDNPVVNVPATLNDQYIFNAFYRLNGKAQLVTKVVSFVVETFLNGLEANPALAADIFFQFSTKTERATAVLKAFGQGLEQKTSKLANLLSTTLRKVIAGAIAAVIVIAAITVTIIYLVDNGTAGKVAERIIFTSIGVLTLGLAVYGLYSAIELVRAAKSVTAAAQSAAIIGAIVATIITWGVFIYQWIASGVSFGSLAFNSMVADAIAATMLIVLMAALACTVVGAIIVAVIGIIDGLISTICAAAGVYNLDENHWARQYVCIGISGWLTKIIKWFLYSQTYLIKYDDSSRLEFTGVDQGMRDPLLGMTTANDLSYSIDVKNTITKSSLPIDWKALLYAWQFANYFVKTSTFAYAIQSSETDIDDDLERGQIKDWHEVQNDKKWEKTFTATTGSNYIDMPKTGINMDPTVYFTEGSAIPVQECWAIWTPWMYIPVCYIRTERNSFSISMGDSLTVDVFPNTLDDFYSLQAASSGYRLDWNNNSDFTFPIIKDADGDGLLSKAFQNGNDPDDTRYDTDNDGLSDAFEIANGTNPLLVDSDSDGLFDYQEIQIGTDPLRKDSDGDGLNDKEETEGWYFTYGFEADGSPLETMVYPDPLQVDADQDGVTDYLERVYGFNPQVADAASVLDYALSMEELDAPALLIKFDETGNASTFDDASTFGFNATCEGSACPVSGVEGRVGNSARFNGSNVLSLPSTAQALTLGSNAPFTLAAWVKDGQNGTMLAKWNSDSSKQEARFYLENGVPKLASGSATVSANTALTSTGWNHVAVIYDGHQATFVINGAQVGCAGSCTWSSPTPADQDNLGSITIGDAFTGTLDEAAIFTRALSVDEVSQRLMPARYNLNDNYVRPGEEIVYHSQVTNLLNSRFAYGLLTTISDRVEAIVNWATEFLPYTFVLYPDNPVVTGVNQVNIDNTIQIDASAASGDLNITQTANVQIVDRRTESNRAELWLTLDEERDDHSYEDNSGVMPPRTAQCDTTCPAVLADSILNAGVTFAQSSDTPVTLNTLDELKLLNSSYTLSLWVKPQAGSTGSEQMTLFKTSNNSLSVALNNYSSTSSRFVVKVNNSTLSLNRPTSFSRDVINGTWNHITLRYDIDSQKFSVYINGALGYEASGVSAISSDATLVFGGAPQQLQYAVDDIRIFARALSTADIARLAERAVLVLNMDSTTFSDSSGYQQSVSKQQSPTTSATAIQGNSLNPGSGAGTGYLRVNGNGQLNLHDGAFTISTWIYPTGGDTTEWQGIYGYRENLESSSDIDAYPTLERKNTSLRFLYGDGANMYTLYANNSITLNRWNYVTVNFTPTDTGQYIAEIFVNSVIKASQLLDNPPASTSSFYVGLTSTMSRTSLGTLYMDDEHDAGSHAEPYIETYLNGSRISNALGEQSMADGDSMNVGYSRSTTNLDHLRFEVWEADDNPDDFCGSYDTYWYMGSESRTVSLNNGFDGRLNVSFERSGLPFAGRIDELSVYRYGLDTQQIFDLYHSVPVTAQLKLDDRPSSNTFDNTAVVGGENDATCTGTACPAAGTTGLINQAARFDGIDDQLTIPVETTSDLMASLWVNTTCTNCGIYTLHANGVSTPTSQIYLRTGNVCTLTGGIEMCSTGGTVSDSQWHHILYSYNANSATLYLDGVLINQRVNNPAINSLSNGEAQLGYAAAATKPYFNGQLDDVRIFRYTALDQLDSLLERAPIFLAHLDEDNAVNGVSDATLTHWTMACTGDTCPSSDIEGRLGKAQNFDGQDDRLSLEQDQLSSTLTDFSVGIWVMPARVSTSAQVLWALNNTDNNNIKYALTLPANGTRVCVMTGDDTSDCDYVSQVDLIQGTWNYVMLTVHRDGSGNEAYNLYINGYRDNVSEGQGLIGSPAGAGRFTLGNQPDGVDFGAAAYAGKLDEPTIYRYELPENDATEVFAYQMGSVEESSTLTMTVDADNPTIDVVSYDSEFPYVANADRLMQVDAADATSGVARVEMNTTYAMTNATEYRDAPVCMDSSSGSSYCPTFFPTSGEGQYNLSFQAIDLVGNTAWTSTYPFIVDATQPHIVIDKHEDELISSSLASWAKNTWYIGLAGTIVDEDLRDSTAGSGVDPESMLVTIYSEAGEIVGAGPQKPDLQKTARGYSWTLNYLIPEKEPTGRLEIVVNGTDRVGNAASISTHILLDATAPVADLDQQTLPGVESSGIQLNDTTTTATMLKGGLLSGTASDVPTDSAPYLTEAGLDAASQIQQVDISLTPALNASYQFNEPYPSGLLAWLPLDKEEVPDNQDGQPDPEATSRMFIDISPYQINGICEGEDCPQAGINGHKNGSIYFDGENRAISLGQQVDLSNRSFSLSLWAKAEETGRNNAMIWQGPASIVAERFLFGLNSANQFVCGFGGTDLISAEQYADTDWHQWTCTFDQSSGERVIYRDGQEIGRDTASPIPAMNENLFIGSAPVGSFFGYLDELMAVDHALTSTEVRQNYTGYQTIFELGVQDQYLVSGDRLIDESGFFHNLELTNAEGSLENKIDAGQVGNYSLSLNGNDTLTVEPAFSLALDRGTFTLAAWVKPEATGSDRYVINQPDENPELRYPSLIIGADGSVSAGFGDGYGWISAATAPGLVPDGLWSHVAVTYVDNTFKIYVNGALAAQSAAPSARLPYPAQSFVIGEGFKGHLDEIQIFARALSSIEVNALNQQGWQTASISGSGNQIDWQAPVPGGLEGPYEINSRAWDGLGHYSTESQSLDQWGGVVDTLNPRLTLLQTPDAEDPEIVHYTFSIEDLTLQESSIRINMCSADPVLQREYFNSSWYLAAGFAPNTVVYRITGSCDGPAAYTEDVGIWACDANDNCSSQTYPANTEIPDEFNLYLPFVIGSGSAAPTDTKAYSQPSEAQRSQAMNWPFLTEALTGDLSNTPPVLSLNTDLLTILNQRGQTHLNIQGNVDSANAISQVSFTISQNGDEIYSANASVYGQIWNAIWVYPIGNAPADGQYTLSITAVDSAGQTSQMTQDITVQLRNPSTGAD